MAGSAAGLGGRKGEQVSEEGFDTAGAGAPRRRGNGGGTAPEAKLAPHSIEAEQGVLGCIFLDPLPSLNLVVDRLAGPEAFYDLRHRSLYVALVDLEKRGVGIDLITVQSSLKDGGLLESVGGLAYLSSLMDAVPSAANLEYYLGIVAEKAQLRRMIQAASTAIGAAHECSDAQALMDQYVADAIAIGDTRPDSAIPEAKHLVATAITHLETAADHRAKGLMLGLTSGFSYFDKKTGGLEKDSLYVIGGRPSTGKTSWACSLLLNMAVKQQIRVGFISIEMSRRIITIRLLCSLAGANLKQVNSGFVTERDKAKLGAAAVQLAKAPWHLIDTPGLTPAQLRAAGRRLVAMGCQVIIIDHLHEVVVPEANGSNSEQVQAAQAAEAARWIARTCHVPVVALAQLSRTFEAEAAKSKFRIPRMTDLRGSGVMEQKADLIGILYKDEERVEEDGSGDEGERRPRVNFNELINWPVSMEICKQRNGPTGGVEFTFLRESLLYVDAYLGTGGEAAAQRKMARQSGEQASDQKQRWDGVVA